MLIVNADDLGANQTATNAARIAYENGVITSASAMVWMSDTARATGIVHRVGIPVGLHLNLTLPFTSPSVPEDVRARQIALTKVFTSTGWQQATDPRPDAALLRRAIADQLEAFHEQFGEPTHIDGHHHVHVQDSVLDLLPRAWPIRPILRRPTHAGRRANRREQRILRRFRGPILSFAFEHVHPALGGAGLDAIELAHETNVEIMTHPQRVIETEALCSEEWRHALARVPVGSYADLGPPATWPPPRVTGAR